MEDSTARRAADLRMNASGPPEEALPLRDLRELLGEVASEADLPRAAILVSHVAGIESAKPGALVFATDPRAYACAMASPATGILAANTWREEVMADPRSVWVRDPKLQFARVAQALELRNASAGGVHPRASVAPGARLGEGCTVGASAVIEDGVVIGRDCRIGPNVTLHTGTMLGDCVVVQAGAVLGSSGFGYVRDPVSGSYLLFPQQGRLVIEDGVEIGANTTIDRGALEETRIGAGTKIDNLVHIAHNCRVGRNVVIAAQTGISGSCIVEDGAVIGGQVGIGDHVTIGEGVILGSGAGILPGKKVEGQGEVFWGIPAQPLRAYLKDLARFRRR